MDDITFYLTNSIFSFVMWILLDKKRFYISWSVFVIFMLIFLFISFKKDNNDKADSGS